MHFSGHAQFIPYSRKKAQDMWKFRNKQGVLEICEKREGIKNLLVKKHHGLIEEM